MLQYWARETCSNLWYEATMSELLVATIEMEKMLQIIVSFRGIYPIPWKTLPKKNSLL